MTDKPEVKRYRCKEPEEIIRVSGVEYIYKYIVDERMQELRDKIEELKHQNSGLRQKIRGKFEWNEIE